MSVHIQIEKFEGPLGLLLHLIRREEMDIFDINIHDITKQYLEYIRAMKKLDLERAGEFVAMAATLIQIKSRMLLPTYDEDGEVVETEDPRKELVRRLLEYQKYQEAGQKLYERPLLGRDLWARGERLKIKSDQEDEIIVEEDNALFALIKAYRLAIKNMRKKTHAVVKSMQSISDRIIEIKHRLTLGKTHRMSEVMTLEERTNIDKILITFLTMLELAKIGMVSIFQNEVFGELYIDPKKEIGGDAISRVDEYEDDRSLEEKADRLLSEAESEAHLQEMKEEESEDAQLALGQWPQEPEEVEPVEAASDDEILAEELRMEEEDQSRQQAADSVEEIASELKMQAIDTEISSPSVEKMEDEIESDDMNELANVPFVSSDEQPQSEKVLSVSEGVDNEVSESAEVSTTDLGHGEELS